MPDTVIYENPADVDALLACKAHGSELTVDALLKEKILTIGENIKVRRFARYEGAVTSYVHAGGRIGVIVKFVPAMKSLLLQHFKLMPIMWQCRLRP